MKTNNTKKIVVSVLALAMGAGLAGSISGSVAWYQYSTRATAQLQGVSTGTSRNLKVRIADGDYDQETGDWEQDLTSAMINTYLGIGGDGQPAALKLNPVTIQTTGNAKDAALVQRDLDDNPNDAVHNYVPAFQGHPVYQYGDLPEVNDKTAGTGANLTYNYVQIPLEFDLRDNGVRKDKAIYLVDAHFNDLSANDNDHLDITPALRAHFSSSTANALLANTAETTAISGELDLNGNGRPDKYGFTGEDKADSAEKRINYGNPGQGEAANAAPTAILSQASWANAEGADNLLANDNDAYTFVGGQTLGTTTTEGDFLKVTLTVWLEGWTKLNGNSIWDAKFNGSSFGLQLRFACVADR